MQIRQWCRKRLRNRFHTSLYSPELAWLIPWDNNRGRNRYVSAVEVHLHTAKLLKCCRPAAATTFPFEFPVFFLASGSSLP